jgi:hypothetical protein
MEVIGYLGNYHRRFRTKMVQKFGYEGFLLQHGVFSNGSSAAGAELVWCEKQLDGAAVARRRAAVADVMARHWRHDAIPTVTAAWGAAHAVACSVRLRTAQKRQRQPAGWRCRVSCSFPGERQSLDQPAMPRRIRPVM